MFGVLGDRQSGCPPSGFLSQHEHFGSLEAWLHAEPLLYLWANGDGARLDRAAH
jgi:hypothetical protein